MSTPTSAVAASAATTNATSSFVKNNWKLILALTAPIVLGGLGYLYLTSPSSSEGKSRKSKSGRSKASGKRKKTTGKRSD
jgi:hypothetical protein